MDVDDGTQASTSAGVVTHGSSLTEGEIDLLTLLRNLTEAYRHVCEYESQEALEAFSKLSPEQYATGWVLSQIGRAHFEATNYIESDCAFTQARHVSPYNLEGMDIYSTVLYLMKDDVKLSYLAQELMAIDRLSPQAWCVLGNCYSLQNNHQTALRNFERAIQLDPLFTYAHTLCGHEHVLLEQYDDGIVYYRSALRINPRHYTAWHGLGMVYLRLGNSYFAEQHFRTANRFNYRNPTIMCSLGIALHALQRNEEALEMLDQAISADPKKSFSYYQKANVLISNRRFREALDLLEIAKDLAPGESCIHSTIAKVYECLDVPDRAMHHFGVALDLQPPQKNVGLIKKAIKRLEIPQDDPTEDADDRGLGEGADIRR